MAATATAAVDAEIYEVELGLKARPGYGLLMHSARLADPTDPKTQRIAALVGQRKKDLGDIEEISREEWEGAMYFDEQIGPYIPARNILNCILESASKFRMKKTLRGGMQVESMDGDNRLPLLYNGPRDLDGMWEAGYVLKQSLKQGQSRVMRTLPIFHDWEIPRILLQVEAAECTRRQLEPILARMTRVGALGDFRPQYGRFDLEVSG